MLVGKHRRADRAGPVDGEGTAVVVTRRPVSKRAVGLAVALLGAWGGIVPYLGPAFGYRAVPDMAAWTWSDLHGLLYLLPGAVAFVAGLSVVLVPTRLAGLVTAAAGAWFVTGPFVWPIYSATPVFSLAPGPLATFTNQVGYNLGVGVLLAVAGGLLLCSSKVRAARD